MDSPRERWERKVEFVAKRLADDEGHRWERLPERSWWLASRVRYRHRATVALGAGNLWDMFKTDSLWAGKQGAE